MNIEQMLTVGYWFKRVLPMNPVMLMTIFGIVLAMFVGGLVCLKVATTKQGLLARKWYGVGKYLVIVGGLELLWVAAHYEKIPFIMQRGWAVVIAIIVGINAYRELTYIWCALPKKASGNEREELKAKYLPKKKEYGT